MPTREIPASTGQRLLWLKLEYERWSAAFNCPIVCRLDGPVDRTRLREALGALYARHEALRTSVVRRHRELRQIIRPAAAVVERFEDLSNAPGAADTHLRNEIATPIDPAQCASRITLWRLGADRHLLCLNLHHFITDTWSCMVLQRELPLFYEQPRPATSPLPPVAWQFGQFMAHQQRQMAGEGFLRHRQYWESQLSGAQPPRLPLHGPQGRALRSRAVIRKDVDASTSRRIRDLAAAQRVTPFTILLSMYYVLLQAVTGQPDLTVATMFANRLRPEVESTVGFIANMVMLRTRLEAASQFVDVIARVHATVTGAIAHQAFPSHVVSGRTSGAAGRLDRVVFQMLGERIDQTCRAADVTFQWLVPEVGGRFDLELAIMPLEDVFGVKLYYATDAASPAWADQFLSGYIAVAEAVASAPRLSVNDVTAAATGHPIN